MTLRRHMEDALRLIAGEKCRNFTGDSCRDPYMGRSPHSPYRADRGCDACIARAGLDGTLPPRPVEIEGTVARPLIAGAA